MEWRCERRSAGASHTHSSGSRTVDGATVAELCPADKARIGKLMQRVVELDRRAEERDVLAKQVQQLQDEQRLMAKHARRVQVQFAESLDLLQSYKSKLDQIRSKSRQMSNELAKDGVGPERDERDESSVRIEQANVDASVASLNDEIEQSNPKLKRSVSIASSIIDDWEADVASALTNRKMKRLLAIQGSVLASNIDERNRVTCTDSIDSINASITSDQISCSVAEGNQTSLEDTERNSNSLSAANVSSMLTPDSVREVETSDSFDTECSFSSSSHHADISSAIEDEDDSISSVHSSSIVSAQLPSQLVTAFSRHSHGLSPRVPLLSAHESPSDPIEGLELVEALNCPRFPPKLSSRPMLSEAELLNSNAYRRLDCFIPDPELSDFLSIVGLDGFHPTDNLDHFLLANR